MRQQRPSQPLKSSLPPGSTSPRCPIFRCQPYLFQLQLPRADPCSRMVGVRRVGIRDQAGGKNGHHHQLRIQQGVCLILHDPQQNGLEVTRVGIGDQAGGTAPPASNSAGSLPHPPFRPSAEWSTSDGGLFWQTGSPPPVQEGRQGLLACEKGRWKREFQSRESHLSVIWTKRKRDQNMLEGTYSEGRWRQHVQCC